MQQTKIILFHSYYTSYSNKYIKTFVTSKKGKTNDLV